MASEPDADSKYLSRTAHHDRYYVDDSTDVGNAYYAVDNGVGMRVEKFATQAEAVAQCEAWEDEERIAKDAAAEIKRLKDEIERLKARPQILPPVIVPPFKVED